MSPIYWLAAGRPPFPPLRPKTSPEPLARFSGCLAPLSGVEKVAGPEGGRRRKGRPWQRPAGRPTRGDPDLRPPPVVASGLGPRRWPLRPCLTPARRPGGDPVLRPPAVQLGVTLTAAVPRSCAAACVLPVPSALARSLQLQQVKKKTKTLTPPHRRRRRPKLLRVTLSPVAGQHDQWPPASGRDSTLHQRPGTDFLRPQNGFRGPCLTTVASGSS